MVIGGRNFGIRLARIGSYLLKDNMNPKPQREGEIGKGAKVTLIHRITTSKTPTWIAVEETLLPNSKMAKLVQKARQEERKEVVKEIEKFSSTPDLPMGIFIPEKQWQKLKKRLTL
jgi:hypothetical protein